MDALREGARPPCSSAERSTAAHLHRELASMGLEARAEPFRALTSPTWTPLFGALLRLGAAALLVGELPWYGLGLAIAALVVAVVPGAAGWVLGRLPGAGGTSHNVVAGVRGTDVPDPPLVVVAHLDSHPTKGAPLPRPLRVLALLVTIGLVAAASAALAGSGVRAAATLLGIEPALAIAWLAHMELGRHPTDADDNDSGLAALLRVAHLLVESPPLRTVWIVATGATTSGGWGMRAFLHEHPGVARVAWVLELDALGTAEIVLCRARRRFPRIGTPAAVVRAVAGAAVDTGDPIDIRRVRRGHSDAVAAFSKNVPALSLTAGLGPPEGVPERDERDVPDPGNVERAARIVERLARTSL